MKTITAPEVKPMTDEVPPSWPPLAHIIRKKDEPVKEGTIALCGVKLMGIDLGNLKNASAKVCDKCKDILQKELNS